MTNMQPIRFSKTRTSVAILGAIGIGAAVIFAFAYYSYANSGAITIYQFDSSLLPKNVNFKELSENEIQSNAKLNEAITKVATKYAYVLNEVCTPNRIVYCDIPSSTEYKANINPSEWDSIDRLLKLSGVSGEGKITSEASEGKTSASHIWQSYIKYDCQSYYLSFGAKVEGYCYYKLELRK